jgi:putative hydrolase of the HAD superfamily
VRGLLLDIGGVIIRTPFELLDAAERSRGLTPGALGPRGPFGPPGRDPEFDQVADGELTERGYWERRARRVAPLLGVPPTTEAFIEVLFDLPRELVVRPETRALIAEVEASGCPVGVLTNDLHDFHGTGWFHDLEVFDHAPAALVDGSLTGHLKPAPVAYQLAVAAMGGGPPGELVYLDDQPVNVTGARSAGLDAIAFDVLDPGTALAAARERLGLTHRSAG